VTTTFKTPPSGLPFDSLPQRDGTTLKRHIYRSDDGPFINTQNSVMATYTNDAISTTKWAQVTHIPIQPPETNWIQKQAGQTQPDPATTSNVITCRIFAGCDGKPDATHAMIPAPVLGQEDNMNVLLSNFDLPAGAPSPNPGDWVQVELYTPPSQIPLYKSLGGSNEPDGKIITSQGTTEAGAINSRPQPGSSKGVYKARSGCDDSPRPNRPSGGRRSLVPPACAQAWGKKSTDLPTTTKGVYPINPVTKVKSKDPLPEKSSQLKIPRTATTGMTLSDQADYGPRVHPVTQKASYHPGVDFNRGNTGVDVSAAPLYAVLDGKVSATGNSATWGKFVILQHGPYYDIVDGGGRTLKGTALYTIYAHLDRPTVRKGHPVKQGAQVAVSDNTGRSTGPHLHFEVIWTKSRFTGFNSAPRTDPVIFFNSKFLRNKTKL
jgi:murein DD-endopeptidase MepM/ murein hydrolase activator NlpD